MQGMERIRQSYSDSEASGPSQIGGCCNVNHPPISFRSQGDQPSRQSHSGPQAGAGDYWEDFDQNNPSIITIKIQWPDQINYKLNNYYAEKL